MGEGSIVKSRPEGPHVLLVVPLFGATTDTTDRLAGRLPGTTTESREDTETILDALKLFVDSAQDRDG
jgi:hypothetical protein